MIVDRPLLSNVFLAVLLGTSCVHGESLHPEGRSNGVRNRHRVDLALGAAEIGVSSGTEGYPQFIRTGFVVKLGYAYRIARGLEIGGGVDYWGVRTNAIARAHDFITTFLVRPYIPLGARDRFELGLSMQVGGFLLAITDLQGEWLGAAIVGGPDLRVWVRDELGLELGFRAMCGGGAQPSQVPEPMTQGALTLGYGAWAGAVAGF